ncbi:MAG TPA: aromatic amino acid lyase, partial [Chitinophagaceae bacterium]|nr:aromatic amino acid lyase [Chitinophagaceae bacterium]
MATKNVLNIDNSWLSFDEVKQFITQNSTIAISNQSIQLVLKCRNFLDEKMANNNALFYGINTGFGFLQNVKIDANQIEQLQYNLLMSHACGMGNEVPTHIVRLMLLLKIKSLSYGNSGVQLNTINALATLCNNNILPIVFMQGSL